MELNKLKVNSKLVEEGAWIDGIPEAGDLRLRVRGIGSAAYRNALSRLTRAVPKNKRNEDDTLPIEIAERIAAEAAAEGLLLDWDNITREGEQVPYDKELAKEWLLDRDFVPFLEAVLWAANKVAQTAQMVEETITKN